MPTTPQNLDYLTSVIEAAHNAELNDDVATLSAIKKREYGNIVAAITAGDEAAFEMHTAAHQIVMDARERLFDARRPAQLLVQLARS